MLSGLYRINGREDYSDMLEYGRLRATISFIDEAIDLVEKLAAKPATFRTLDRMHWDIYDDLANLTVEAIFAATSVSSPDWTAWAIQHNAVWQEIFKLDMTPARKIIALKVRRLLYNEIVKMNTFANFKGARTIAYCLNILGLKLVDRHKGYPKEFYPLQAAVLFWVKKNYSRLLRDHPKVAKACLTGTLTYEPERHRIVKTYSNDTGKTPSTEALSIDV